MQLTKVTDVEKNLKELEVTIGKEEFADAVTKAFRENSKKVSVPGFRKGHAPRSVIEKMYGKGVFYEEALNDIVPSAYEAAVTEAALDVVSSPKFDVKTIGDDGVVFTAQVYVKPECTLKAYKGLEVETEEITVTDDAVDHELDTVRHRNAREIDVTDRAAQNGDTVSIDFEGFCDGKAFDGGKAEKYSLKLGSGSFIPGFEDQICGHVIGDSFDVDVTFPEQYQEASLAGKPAVFKCKLHAIKEEELPALDDEFAKDVSEFDTLDEYKAEIKSKLEESAKNAEKARTDEKLMDLLVENLEAEIPEAMFESETDACLRDYENSLRYQGMDIETFMKYTGATAESLRTQMRPRAERNVKIRLALETVAKLENLEASEEKVEEEYNRIATAYGLKAEDVKARVAQKDIAADVVVSAALDLVRENASIKTKKPAAKKTSAKKAAPADETTETTETGDAPAKKTTKKPAASSSEKKTTSTAAKSTTAKKTTAKKAEDKAE